MSNPTLINGFEDVLTFLSQQANVIKKLQEKNKELRECVDRNQKEIDRLQELIDVEGSSSDEEEKCKYDNEDEWRYAYGWSLEGGWDPRVGKRECRITMAGGGDHWYDYVINKDECFIHSKEGKQKVRAFIICDPEIRKDYLKVIELNDPEYKLDKGEQNMRDVIEECYPEVLESEEEDSDEGSDSEEEDEEQ
jgi:hypothetical protein